MAVMMSMDKDVLVYIDIEGVKMLVKTSKDMKFKDFPTLFELLDQLAAKKSDGDGLSYLFENRWF